MDVEVRKLMPALQKKKVTAARGRTKKEQTDIVEYNPMETSPKYEIWRDVERAQMCANCHENVSRLKENCRQLDIVYSKGAATEADQSCSGTANSLWQADELNIETNPKKEYAIIYLNEFVIIYLNLRQTLKD